MRALSRNSMAIVAVVLLGLLLLPTAGTAQGALQLITPYPAVSVESGKNVNLSIKVVTPTPRRVDLSVAEVPPGWQATLTGGGYTVNGVFGDPDEPPTIQLNVKVPPGVARGVYRVVVRGASGGAQQLLPIDLTVAEVVEGAVTLTSDSPSKRGAPDGTFNYKLTLVNNTPESTTFNLTGEGPPQGPRGWEVNVHPSAEDQATSIKVDGGSSAEITADVDPPDGVTAGKYPIMVRAEAGDKRAEAALEVQITGSGKLTLTTPNERLNAEAVAGRASEVDIVVKNEGTSQVNAVKLSSSPPTGWKVTFRPETIDRIPARGTARAVAVITPSGDAVAGDYNVTMTAAGQAGTSSDAEFRVTVKTSRIFGLVGLLVIGGAIYFLLRVFNQYGRR